METLRFLMVTTHYPPFNIGGDAVMVMNLSRELRKRGHEVHIFSDPSVFRIVRRSVGVSKDSSTEDQKWVHELKMRTQRLGTGSSHVFGLWGRAIRELNELSSSLRPDVVHWHNTRAMIGRPFEVKGAMSIYTAHDYSLVCPKGNLLRHNANLCNDPKLCQTCLLRSGKAPQLWRVGRRVVTPTSGIKILAPSEFMAGRLRQDSVPVYDVIRNFAPDPKFRREQRTERRRISYVGILEPHKGLRTLLDAFSSSSDMQEFNLIIIGSGSLQGWLESEVRRRHLENRVNIKGFLERQEMLEILSGSEAVVIPSEWYENAPLVALEAIAMGVPIITSDIGGLPEIAQTTKGSSSFIPWDSRDLAATIVTLWNDIDNLCARSSAARDAYLSMYTPDKHIENYMSVLSHA